MLAEESDRTQFKVHLQAYDMAVMTDFPLWCHCTCRITSSLVVHDLIIFNSDPDSDENLASSWVVFACWQNLTHTNLEAKLRPDEVSGAPACLVVICSFRSYLWILMGALGVWRLLPCPPWLLKYCQAKITTQPWLNWFSLGLWRRQLLDLCSNNLHWLWMRWLITVQSLQFTNYPPISPMVLGTMSM